MRVKPRKTVVIIVAKPGDETLWAGGTILCHPNWNWTILSLSGGNDAGSSQKFSDAVSAYKAKKIIGSLELGDILIPIEEANMEQAILDLFPKKHIDLVITHNPSGECTRNLRHEEISKSVIKLWNAGKISTSTLWTFAYEDGNKEYAPTAIETGTEYRTLTNRIWQRKYALLTETCRFESTSWEVENAPKAEAFWEFTDPYTAQRWLKNGGVAE